MTMDETRPQVFLRRLEACATKGFHPFGESRRLMRDCHEKFYSFT